MCKFTTNTTDKGKLQFNKLFWSKWFKTEGFSSFGVAIGEATWWGGFGAESYGNFLLKDYNKIWQDALRRGLRYSTKPVFKNKNGYGN